MFTSMDKAIVAAVMGGLYILSYFTGINFGLTEGQVASLAALVTPVLVWLVPNKAVPA